MAYTKSFDPKLVQKFKQDCSVFNLKKEYPYYEGSEKWGVITDLTEDELLKKHSELMAFFSPYLLFTVKQGEPILDYIRNEDKFSKRADLTDSYSYDDELTAAFHHELIGTDYWGEQEEKERKEKKADLLDRLSEAIEMLNPTQQSRLKAHFYAGKTTRDIAAEEGVSHTAVIHSLNAAIKNLKKFLK